MASQRPGAAWHAQRREEGCHVIERPTRGHDAARQGDGVVRFELRRAHPSAPGLEFDADETARRPRIAPCRQAGTSLRQRPLSVVQFFRLLETGRITKAVSSDRSVSLKTSSANRAIVRLHVVSDFESDPTTESVMART